MWRPGVEEAAYSMNTYVLLHLEDNNDVRIIVEFCEVMIVMSILCSKYNRTKIFIE